MRANKLKQIWASGQAATNCWLMLPTAIAAEMLAHQGWDSLTVDQQHGQADHAAMVAMLTAIATTDATPLVRVKWNDPGDIMRALDAGAYGVICPMIETAEECARFVGACRYAPAGYRSYGPRRAEVYGGAGYFEHANDMLLTIVQVETVTGMANIEAIAAVPGLDMLYLGPSDLAISMGRRPHAPLRDPDILAAADRVVMAAKAAGLKSGIFCGNPDDALAMIARGFDLVTAVVDDALLAAGGPMRARFS